MRDPSLTPMTGIVLFNDGNYPAPMIVSTSVVVAAQAKAMSRKLM